jgi:hypothetical protein
VAVDATAQDVLSGRGVAGVVMSPPWADSLHRGIVVKEERDRHARGRCIGQRHVTPIDVEHARQDGYGTTDGQIGRLKGGPGTLEDAPMPEVETLDWRGCYAERWADLLVPEAMAHPAKFSVGLISRIYDHGFARGWWRKGDLVADCFAGVACGGVLAAYKGLRWVGVELEPRFCDLARRNFELHRRRWEAAGDPVPVIVQGDSRRFAEAVRGAAGLVTSPPYAELGSGGNARSSPIDPTAWTDGRPRRMGASVMHGDGYGTTPGQIGALPAGDVDAVVTSPPYADTEMSPRLGGATIRKTAGQGGRIADRSADLTSASYGATPGQIGALAAGDVDAVVTSPPWENQEPSHAQGDPRRFGTGGQTYKDAVYGTATGQIGRDVGETYWDAVAQVYAQCLLALKPGGVACIVVKGYVRRGQLVDLPGQTLRLLLSLGFEPVERIRAWLVEERREAGLFGEVVTTKSRASFFRRLATKRGAPPIDFEEILVVRKPPTPEAP